MGAGASVSQNSLKQLTSDEIAAVSAVKIEHAFIAMSDHLTHRFFAFFARDELFTGDHCHWTGVQQIRTCNHRKWGDWFIHFRNVN
jgi:hypothetical protein